MCAVCVCVWRTFYTCSTKQLPCPYRCLCRSRYYHLTLSPNVKLFFNMFRCFLSAILYIECEFAHFWWIFLNFQFFNSPKIEKNWMEFNTDVITGVSSFEWTIHSDCKRDRDRKWECAAWVKEYELIRTHEWGWQRARKPISVREPLRFDNYWKETHKRAFSC